VLAVLTLFGLTASLATTALATTALGTSAAASPAERVAAAAAPHASVTVRRGGPDRTVTFHRAHAGEAFLDVVVSARGISWARHTNDSAVVSAYVDGRYATDIVITSAGPVRRRFALGLLHAGRHTLRLHYAARRSRSDAGAARVRHIRFETVRPGSTAYAVARYAPVLRGRNVDGLGGRFQNNRSDTPLLAWHQVLPAGKPGHRVIEYSVLWSNEDGGTPVALLMAQWGRTTDIEWVYRVEVDSRGRRVPGTGEFQAPAHQTLPFHGRYAGTHPVLQTCTSNNNVCDRPELHTLHQAPDPMRFALSARPALALGQPREHEMDTHPWTYQVMGREMVREKKVERHSSPSTPLMGDQRRYLYVAVDRDTDPVEDAATVGLAVDVTLQNGATYTSDHEEVPPQAWTVDRDGAAATTVELPRGTTVSDIASISVRRVPIAQPDNGATLTVTRLRRAFFLDRRYLPQPSFAHWQGSTTLTTGEPVREIWTPS
jgi:hypothetical protein